MVEQKNAERRITWEVVEPQQFRSLLADTLEETVLQNVAAACSSASLLRIMPPQAANLGEIIGLVETTTNNAVDQLRAMQKLLRQVDNMPIPIDHSYENSGGRLIIALDAIGNPPK